MTASFYACFRSVAPRAASSRSKVPHEFGRRNRWKTLKHLAYQRSSLRIGCKPPSALENIAERWCSADIEAAAHQGSLLVPSPVSRQLALELCEGEQDIENKPAHGIGSIKGLRHADEAGSIFFKRFDQADEIAE